MKKTLLDYFPAKIAGVISNLDDFVNNKIVEIRMRVNQPLQIITDKRNYFIDKRISKNDIEKSFMILTQNSIYAVERQLAEGFITIPGGHRVGFTGQVVIENNRLKTLKNINSLNYRIVSEKIGVGEKVIRYMYCRKQQKIYNTLIISPPLCGKTTLLRDLIRIISTGMPSIDLKGKKVGLVDERSEIAGAYNGVPQNKIGNRTDLLDNCPKAVGMMMLIRTMSPEVIAVDEIGKKEDVSALKEATNAGVSMITTIHGKNIKSMEHKAVYSLIKNNFFERYIILSRRKGIGTIEKILDNCGKEVYKNDHQAYRSSLNLNFR
ncbi:MAG: stage III sporulation protein AA [Halothermotrichaceae bacterium]